MELINLIIDKVKDYVNKFVDRKTIFVDKYSLEAQNVVNWFDFTPRDLQANQSLISNNREFNDVKNIIWFIPEFDNPFWGGIYTILRFADYLKSKKGVQSRFVIIGNIKRDRISEEIGKAFPKLKSDILILQSEQELDKIEEVDATICTLWTTAYYSLKFNKTKRKFYFIQDYEPLFYPAGSESALVDATYQFGFYGIANTITLKNIYENEYNGIAEYFNPCVDKTVFFPIVKPGKKESYTVFFYGRPGHPRNGFELGIAALRKLKEKMGGKVNIVTAGAIWDPSHFGLEGVVENLGLLSYEETANLYRRCDLGLIMMFTRHPSYIPFELMASGCLVVTNFNRANTWLLHNKVNCLLSPASASCLCQTIEEGLNNIEQRKRIVANALGLIAAYSNWGKEIEKIYHFICDPDNTIKIEYNNN
jgi:O-antigen biosynthesis protein